LRERFGVDAKLQSDSVFEDDNYLYMRSRLMSLDANRALRFTEVTFVLGERMVMTICEEAGFQPFAVVLQRCIRKPSSTESAKAMLRLLLQVATDSAAQVIARLADELESSTNEISAISEGYNEQGVELGVTDLIETMRSLNDKEELISRCLEAQLSLARTVRYLSGEVDNRTEADLQALVSELAGDVAGVKEHAAFEHEKVRYLQNAVTNILNIKQNQIVKVFTIITAVFLPPTLVGTFYGMNFAVMPELSWKHGFIYSMVLTLSAALLPLAYIKRKGWLR
jgi:magnesium transporter